MEKKSMRGLFALGPAPPGYRPPNTSLFARLESHLLTLSRHIKHTTARIDRMRNSMQIEENATMRFMIKEQVLRTVKEQIRERELLAKYGQKLKALQEAEILKVAKHMHEIDTNCQDGNIRLARLRVSIKKEVDPDIIRRRQEEIITLMREQEKARDLRERWRVRLVQMEAAKVKVIQPSLPVSKKIPSPKPMTATEDKNKVVVENKKQNIHSPKPMTATEDKNKVVVENKKQNIHSPKPMTATEHMNKKVMSENIRKDSPKPKPETATICISKAVTLKAKETIDKGKKGDTDCKRCAFLQRINKYKNRSPTCSVCLKWSHKVLEDGVEKKSKAPNKTDSELSMTPTVEPEIDTDFESTIKVEIEPLTGFSMLTEDVTPLDPPKSLMDIDIEPLDASMNDEIMSDVIKEDETENFANKESIDFEKVTAIHDELRSIEDKNTALAHVRNLQEYAMLNDNYRAIGLLSQVEAALISPPKNDDFDC